jgi:hypothetical protein
MSEQAEAGDVGERVDPGNAARVGPTVFRRVVVAIIWA